MSPVIDVHTHCLTEAWFELLQKHGGPRYTVKAVTGGLRAIHLDGAPFMTPVPPMFDYDLRLKTMNDVGVDIGIVSLTCPNCYWGGSEVSLKAAQIMNGDMAAARCRISDRGWISATTTVRHVAKRSRANRRNIYRRSVPTPWSSRRRCSNSASTCSARATCSTAPTIRTRSATCRDA